MTTFYYLLDPILHLTFLIDALFGVLAIMLVRNIFAKTNAKLMAPFLISAFAVGVLLFFYLTDAVSIANVWLNSHQSTPLLYKIAGIWGNHEGSMLLFFTFLTAWAMRLRHSECIRLASFVLLALGGYLYFAANPFMVLTVKMIAGQDLNPALQNPYLAIHPPILYAGQTLCFLLWIKACLTPDDPKIPFYTRLCFGLITLGLALGARWAYGELGWGGFWFWDPVETVSLFPWLAIAAAVHVCRNDVRRQRLCLLITFPIVMLGLTLVRSGVLVSVHSFGFDAFNGIWLGVCTLMVGVISIASLRASVRGVAIQSVLSKLCTGSSRELALSQDDEKSASATRSLRSPQGCGNPSFSVILSEDFASRENPGFSTRLPVAKRGPVPTFRTAIPIGFLCILVVFCALTLVPVLAKICLNANISIDESFFHQYINPCLLGLLLFAGLAPHMKAHWWSFASAGLCTGLWCLLVQPHFHLLAICAALVGFWLMLSSLNHIKSVFTKGFVAAHLGVGLCILGASHAEIFTTKQEFNLNQLSSTFAAQPLHYMSQTSVESPSITKEIFTISIAEKLLQPEIQHFHISRVTKHQTAITRVELDDVHATVFKEEDRIKIELTHKPLINIFWLGILIVLIGIGVSARCGIFNGVYK